VPVDLWCDVALCVNCGGAGDPLVLVVKEVADFGVVCGSPVPGPGASFVNVGPAIKGFSKSFNANVAEGLNGGPSSIAVKPNSNEGPRTREVVNSVVGCPAVWFFREYDRCGG
jgi:hypothetical protein